MVHNIKDEALQYAAQHQQAHLEKLKEFLRIRSVSTEPELAEEVRAAAQWLAQEMQQAGLENVHVHETAQHPLVTADWLHAGPEAPTLLVYGHYDVQPAAPEEEWQSPAFEPEMRGDYLYARGVSDDKGQVYIHVKAAEAYLKSGEKLPVNLKFIVEGEEEIGGKSLTAFIPENEELLDADVVIVSDTAMAAPDRPAIVYGLRGMCYMTVDVSGPDHDLHSGAYGGGINNPLNVLGHIIAGLRDEDGHVLIPGFYDDVRPLSEEERQLLSGFPADENKWLADTGAPAVWGEPEHTLAERIGGRPTLDVNGIVGGYTGAGSKTIIPARVHAKISMRLVPDQRPERIEEKFRRYVRDLAPPSVDLNITAWGMAQPVITDVNSAAVRAAASAYAAVFGQEPIFRREGGSIPVVGDFQKYLGLDTVLMGFGLPDDRIHSPNERFYLPNFYRGIETVIHFLAEHGAQSSRARADE